MTTDLEKEKIQKKNLKTYVILGSVLYVGGVFSYLHAKTIMSADKRISFADAMDQSFKHILANPFNIHVPSGTLGMIALATVLGGTFLFAYFDSKKFNKHDDPNTVNGEAHLMNSKELKQYNLTFTSPIGKPKTDGENNMIISQEIRLAIDGFATKINCNILVIGGSGAGKSRYFASPNILQYNCNFVITDPSGEMLEDWGKGLEDNGYDVKVFNISDMYKGNRYNPFHYIRAEHDVFILVNTLIKNTNSPDSKGGDQFWEKSETLLLNAIILYLWHKYPKDSPKQNFTEVMRLINMADIDENADSTHSALDDVFDDFAKQYQAQYPGKECLANTQYKTFKLAAGKTLKSILISVGVRLQSFQLENIRYLTERDEFHFENFADTKKALFILIPTADSTFNFLVSLLYSQLFSTLYKYAESTSKFGYKVILNDGTIIRVEHAGNKDESEMAQKRAEDFAERIKKKTHVAYDGIKKLYNVYTDLSNEDKTQLEKFSKKLVKEKYIKKKDNTDSECKPLYIITKTVEAQDNNESSGNAKRPKNSNYFDRLYSDKEHALYLFSSQKDATNFVENNLDVEACEVEDINIGMLKKKCGPKCIFSINYFREGATVPDNYKMWDLIGWRGTKELLASFEEQLKTAKTEKCKRKCPVHVRFILDEFANIGQIPDFDQKLATMRKYEISCSIILQALSQLKDIYKDKWNTLAGNCDTKLFLGSDDQETIKWLVEQLGKKTTAVENTSLSDDRKGSSSVNRSSIEILTVDQISMMATDECIVKIRGVRPYYGKKYDLTKHPNYKYAHSVAGTFYIPPSGKGFSETDIPFWQRLEMLKADGQLKALPETTEDNESDERGTSGMGVPTKDDNSKNQPGKAAQSDNDEDKLLTDQLQDYMDGQRQSNRKKADKYNSAAKKISVEPNGALSEKLSTAVKDAYTQKQNVSDNEIKEIVESIILYDQDTDDIKYYTTQNG